MKNSLKGEHQESLEANRFLVAHCETTLADIRKLVRGINHSVNLCNADHVECWNSLEKLREQLGEQTRILSETVAEVGKLQESLEKSRIAYGEIQKKLNS